MKVEEDMSQDTPYTPYIKKDGTVKKVYSDHRPISFAWDTKLKGPKGEKSQMNKEVRWRYNAPKGKIKYSINTSKAAPKLIEAILSEASIDEVVNEFMKAVDSAKMKSYGKVTMTKKKIEETDARRMWQKAREDIEKNFEEMKKDPATKQVWKMREKVNSNRRDTQKTAVMREDTGQMLEDEESITDYLLNYNVENMAKEKVSDEVYKLGEEKKMWVKLIIEKRDRIPKEITWVDFMRTLEKVRAQGKPVFKDLMLSGEDFKVALFLLCNRIYKEEIIPEMMRVTTLSKIWKRKGDPARICNTRFIHTKGWLPKFFEKLIVMMVEKSITEATPELQAGGQPNRSTRDHLLKLNILMRSYQKQGKPLPLLAVDVRACFDRCKLSDLIFDVACSGADPKNVRIINNFTKATLIRMSGDKTKKGMIVLETAGQGSVFAPLACALSMGKSLEQQFEDFCELAKMGAIYIPPFGFIDDVLVNADSEEGMRIAALRVSKALDNLSLKSNENKTALIIVGNNKATREMREAFRRNPLKVQDHEVRLSEMEPYLGFKISQKGWRDSLDRTLDHRTAKAWSRVLEIRDLAKHPKMRKVGWMKTAVTLVQSLIIPSLLYSTEAWVDPLVRQMSRVESTFKKILYSVLEIHESTSYSGVLYECGLPLMTEVAARLRIIYANELIWGKIQDGLARKMIIEDDKMLGKKSWLQEISNLCTDRRIPDVSYSEQGPKTIKRLLKTENDSRIWFRNLCSRKVIKTIELKNPARWNQLWDKLASRVYLFYKVGSLRFRATWKGYYERKGEDILCLSELCGTEEDTLEHAKKCRFLDTKWNEFKNSNPRELTKFLTLLRPAFPITLFLPAM